MNIYASYEVNEESGSAFYFYSERTLEIYESIFLVIFFISNFFFFLIRFFRTIHSIHQETR